MFFSGLKWVLLWWFHKRSEPFTLLTLTARTKKKDGWKTIVFFWDGFLAGALLVSGRVHLLYPNFPNIPLGPPFRWCAWILVDGMANPGKFETRKGVSCLHLRKLQQTSGTYTKPSTTCLFQETLSYIVFWVCFRGLLEFSSRLN